MRKKNNRTVSSHPIPEKKEMGHCFCCVVKMLNNENVKGHEE